MSDEVRVIPAGRPDPRRRACCPRNLPGPTYPGTLAQCLVCGRWWRVKADVNAEWWVRWARVRWWHRADRRKIEAEGRPPLVLDRDWSLTPPEDTP